MSNENESPPNGEGEEPHRHHEGGQAVTTTMARMSIIIRIMRCGN